MTASLAKMKRLLKPIYDWLRRDPRLPRFAMYIALTWILHPKNALTKLRERRFYSRLLGRVRSGVIFDLGASNGGKAEIFYRHSSKVVCLEPSPQAADSLRKRFAHCDELTIVEAAVSDSLGTGTLLEFEPGSAYNTLHKRWAQTLSQVHTNRFGFSMPAPAEREVRLVTIDRLIAEHGRPRYIKLDVEGFEWLAIKGMGLPCEIVSAEFNLPEFLPDLENAVRKLELLGNNVGFNAVISEPPIQFEFSRWQSGAVILEQIRNAGWGYVELYCRSSPTSEILPSPTLSAKAQNHS
jgi:FkbM family methyltransferase